MKRDKGEEERRGRREEGNGRSEGKMNCVPY
jgi:hypothetical protein